MTLKTFGFGAMLAAAVVGVTVASAPAQASTLKADQALNLRDGYARLEIGTGAKAGTALLNFSDNQPQPPTSAKYNLTPGLGKALVSPSSSDPVFGKNSTATLKDLKLIKFGTSFVLDPNFLDLKSEVSNFIQLTNGIVFNLKSFTLVQSGVHWLGDYKGQFVAGNTTIDGVGTFDTSDDAGTFRLKKSKTRGSDYIINSHAIPTPALLPGLLGLSVAALRKRKSEESDVEATETAKA